MNNNNEQPICEIDRYGTKWWRLNDELHRLYGPAIEWASQLLLEADE